MCKSAVVKTRISFYLQFWPIVAALIGGFLYEIRTVDNLSVRIGQLEKQSARVDDKLDKLLLFRMEERRNAKWNANDGKGTFTFIGY